MDRGELVRPILEDNQDLTRRIAERAACKDLAQSVPLLHRAASDAAERLLDKFKPSRDVAAYQMQGHDSSGRDVFGFSTGLIALGEVDPDTETGRTHGFAQVTVWYEADPLTVVTRKATRFRPAVTDTSRVASDRVSYVRIDIMSGDAAAERVSPVGKPYRTPMRDMIFRIDSVENHGIKILEGWTQEIAATIEVLDCLAVEAGLQPVV